MPHSKRFLIVDDNPDGRSLLVRTLLRKFPRAFVTECADADRAVTSARVGAFDAIIVHRAGEVTGIELIALVRKAAPEVPLIYVSGVDRGREAFDAGASAFLNYDAWLGLGTLVATLLEKPTEATPLAEPDATHP